MGLEDFTVGAGAEHASYYCAFDNIGTAISLRHSDTVDVKYRVNGKPVVIALALAGFATFRDRAGRALTDTEAIQMAGLFLKNFIEQAEQIDTLTLPVNLEQTVALAQQITGMQANLPARSLHSPGTLR